MVHPARFELATTWFEAKYSNPLSYGCTHHNFTTIYTNRQPRYTTSMDVHTAISLKNYTTMRLGGDAKFMAAATTPEEVVGIYRKAKEQGLSVFVLGGGSNVVVPDEGYDGIILLNRIKGFEVLFDDKTMAVIKIGAGEIWDEIVEKTVNMGLSGIEALSAIPGTAGAAPVQNIGAYGQEVADTLVELEAYDSHTDKIVKLSADDCDLTYRNSIFRDEAVGRFCILNITLKLYYTTPKPPFYAALQQYLDEEGISIYTPDVIRVAVMTIRNDKLPNPDEKPNSGSFFKNALIEQWQFDELIKKFPDMPHYEMPDGRLKIPTGWLIEKAGLKGQLLHGMRVHTGNALVLINESAANYADLAAARAEIIQKVYDMFRIQIEQEPLELK